MTSRRRSRSSFDQAVHGAQVPLTVPISERCATCSAPAPGPAPPDVCPRCEGRGDRVPGPGDVLDLPALLALRRQRHGDREPVPDLQRHRRDARRQAPARQHPGRRPRRQPHPPRRQGRARAAQRAARRPLRDHARGASPVFEQKGENLEVEVPLTVVEALRGAEIEVPTLNGRKRCASPRDQARHRPAPARRGTAAAGRQGQRRHPLPLRDRRAVELNDEQAKAVDKLSEDDERRPAREAVHEAGEPRRGERADGLPAIRTTATTRGSRSPPTAACS